MPEHSDFNVDLGAAVQFTCNIMAGLNVRDIIFYTYTSSAEPKYTYHMRPLVTTGISWNGPNFVLAADIDITKIDSYDYTGDERQSLRFGGEYNLIGLNLNRLSS